jgi:Autographiviridae endonuclease
MVHHTIIPVEPRKFWAKVRRSKDCWEWTGQPNANGYGAFHWWAHGKSRATQAHRVSWFLTHGPIPADMYVLHMCDNRKCVRPSHLFLGTQQDNIKDMHAKHRWKMNNPSRRDGSLNPCAKHTERDIHRMLALHKAGFSQVRISRLFGISRPQLCMIVNNKAWRHVAR